MTSSWREEEPINVCCVWVSAFSRYLIYKVSSFSHHAFLLLQKWLDRWTRRNQSSSILKSTFTQFITKINTRGIVVLRINDKLIVWSCFRLLRKWLKATDCFHDLRNWFQQCIVCSLVPTCCCFLLRQLLYTYIILRQVGFPAQRSCLVRSIWLIMPKTWLDLKFDTI